MQTRRPFISGNWKMHKTCSEALSSAKELTALTKNSDAVDIMIAPSFTSLFPVSQVLKDTKIMLGAQNFFWEKAGAFTGEISSSMLVSAGCSHVITGHSERREKFGETDEIVNKKIFAAFNADLIPILCIGETLLQRESKETFNVLDKQVSGGLKGLSETDFDLKKLIIAYEPIWAIGTGKTATSTQAQEVHQFLRSIIDKKFGTAIADSVRIIYGGSVKPANISELMNMPDIDGALVGGASLDMKTFNNIVRFG